MRRHQGAVALSTAPRGSMKRGRGQFAGTSSTMPCHVHVANLGPRAILAASLRSQLAWLGRRECWKARRGLGMVSCPPTTAVAVASSGPRRRCHAAAALYIDMTSRWGFLSSRMYGERKRERKGMPRAPTHSPVEGVGCARGSSECEEAIATRPTGAKKRVRASGSPGSASGMQRSGRPLGPRMAGTAKIRPSEERKPSGRLPIVSRAADHGAPTRMA